MSDASRTALLIGVGANPGAERHLRSLSTTVDADLRAMGAALRGSGYAVETLRDPTRNEVTEHITALSTEASADSTLLFYFTGHGVRVGDTDYLVPADAQGPADGTQGGWDQPHVRESLLEADISKYLAHCRADTVLWLIDACRSDEGGGAAAFGSRIVQGPPNAGFAMMTGCAPGERCGFSEAGSFFSLALAHAFDPLTEATTVDQVYQATRRHTRYLARRARAEPQQVQIHYGSDLEAECKLRDVAHGRRLLEAWQDVVYTPALWEHVREEGDTNDVGRLQDCLVSLAEEVARHVHHAQERLPDPWADDEFAVRLLRDRLPMLLPKGAELSALEVTALIAGVLLHEAAWADRLSQAAELHPQFVERRSDADAQRRHYEQIAEQHPQITEKLANWYWWETGPSDERYAAMLWLVHRWIAERFTTDEQPVPEVWADGFVARLLKVALPEPGATFSGRAAQLSAALRAVAMGLTFGAPPDEQKPAFPDRHVVRNVAQPLRVRPLAALLRLAGLLAFDARHLPEVVAEHLAVSDTVTPREVITVFRDAVWDLDHAGDTPSYLHLDAVCPHPAIHAALASVIEDADELGHTLKEMAGRLPVHESALLQSLPTRLTDHRLRPDKRDGLDAYDMPLAHFSLSQTEIRRLLMGEQLYDGNSSLALRELYQNALDACRYRELRGRYLLGCGKQLHPWAGTIRIEMGEDDRGRYVECLDNGIGMTVDQLRNTFTRAGRRFDQSHSFRREQAIWLRQDKTLRLYPNSRFGIGVFSYFMLAEEMTVITRPVGPDGRPADRALRVDIPVSGSLFRVREADEHDGAFLADGGTRVRLYLRNPYALTGGSCASVLRSLVLFSEFTLEVKDADGRPSSWLPHHLHSGEGRFKVDADSALEAVPGILWWVKGEGAIVCDGIVSDQRPFGYVLNLTGEHAGKLSVNRNKLEKYDVRWARELFRLGSTALAEWSELSLGWMRTMESNDSAIARILWREWQGRGVRATAGYGRTVNLDEVGWFKLDSSLGTRTGRHEDERVQSMVRPWRTAVLRYRQPYDTLREAAPVSLEGFPVPSPGWSDIARRVEGDWRSAVKVAATHRMTVSEVVHATRGMRLAHPKLAGPAVFREGSLDWNPDHVTRVIVAGLLGPEYNALQSLSGSVTGREPTKRFSSNGIFYRHSPEDLSGIVRTSTEWNMTLGELMDACAKFAPFLREPLPTVPDHHREYVCTEEDLAVLYLPEDERSWRPTVTPWDVRAVAQRLGSSPYEVQRRLAAFGWLRPVPALDLVDRWTAVPDDIFSILRRYVVDTGTEGPILPWAATIDLAAEWEIPVRTAERILSKSARALGLDQQRRYRKGAAGRDEIPSPETGNLVAWLHNMEIRLEDGVSLRDLAYVQPHEMTCEELSWCADELRAAGVELPDAARLLEAWDDLPMPSRYAFSGVDPSFDAANYPVPATAAVLFTASQQLREKLSYLWKTARQEAKRLKLGPHLVAVGLPAELRKFRPTNDETAALVDYGWDDESDGEWCESPSWAPLTPVRLVGYARARRIGVRTAYEKLTPLRTIGALVPELPPQAIAALPDDVPDAYDAAAVDPAHRVSTPGSPLVALDLVSIAGRLGESVLDTWRRVTPYLALEGPQTALAALPDTVPRWQDLAILSERLDGMLPAYDGSVDQARLNACAQAVGETPRWVKNRLETYAGMFGLDMTSVDDREDSE
ncbi:caspase family protein [Streptomyces sp. NPDC093018]|uniref:HD domain-containing protein n=1 Tax=Streptomyces sp. NPDC093018 TaxID=3155067 RepID=UPI00341C24BC